MYKGELQGFVLIIILALTGAVFAGDKVYKTVDEDGNVVYTDEPPSADARPEVLKALSIVTRREQQAVTPQPAEPAQTSSNSNELRRLYQGTAR